MMKMFLQHSAGLGELVHPALEQDLGAKIIYADDSALIINTNAAIGKINSLSYITNAFLVQGSVPRRGALERAVDDISRKLPGWRSDRVRPGRPFRIMYSDQGKLTRIKDRSRSQLESAIGRQIRGRLNPRGGSDGLEYWVISRRDLDQVLLARRITSRRSSDVAKGALRPDLAALLISAAGARKSDIFLDPFGGSGALVAARLATACKRAIYSDTALADLRNRLHPAVVRSDKVELLAEDARELPSIADHSIDVIVTDPPWNEFAQTDDYAGFLRAALASFHRVLRNHGRLAMLVSRQGAADVERGWGENSLDLDRRIDVLVNGHPATVLVGRSARRSPR